MRRTRRHKLLQISVFFLIYSLMYVLSENSSQIHEKHIEKEVLNISSKPTTEKLPAETSTEPIVTRNIETTVTTPKNKKNTTKKNATRSSMPCAPSAIEQLRRSKRQVGHNNTNIHHANDTNTSSSSTSTSTTSTTAATSTGTTKVTQKPSTSHATKTTHKTTKQMTTSPKPDTPKKKNETNITAATCMPPAMNQFPRPLMGPYARKHGGLIIHIIIAVYAFLGLAIVCDDYFVASLERICEELKIAPDVAGATFMAAGSSGPELATVIIGVFFAKDDIGISGVIGSAVFNIMFVISVCALCTTTAIYLNWWPLIRDCFFYAVAILVMLITIQNEMISWVESLFMLLMYVVYCVALHFNTALESWAQRLPLPFKKASPDEQSALVSYKTLEEDGKQPSYGGSPERTEGGYEGYDNQLSGPALNQASSVTATQAPPSQQDYYKPKETDHTSDVNPLQKPIDAGMYKTVTWAIVLPIHFLCLKTIPDCRSEQYKNWYPFTFFMSMIWISFYSYFMVWMITVIGTTCGIPDTVMGLTFVAAGVSVPDALSSIAVMKEGYGDMAVSNAVGSNIFDILMCLGLPWFIKTAIIKPGSVVVVTSRGLTYSTLSLLSTVVFLVVATHLNGWKLDRKFGVVLMAWYLVFITFASLYELNVFGDLNPPECESDY